jgi:hypothetical protein
MTVLPYLRLRNLRVASICLPCWERQTSARATADRKRKTRADSSWWTGRLRLVLCGVGSCLGTPRTSVSRRNIRMLPAQTRHQGTDGHPNMAAWLHPPRDPVILACGCVPLPAGLVEQLGPLAPVEGGPGQRMKEGHNCSPRTVGESRRGTPLPRSQYQRGTTEPTGRTPCIYPHTTYAVRHHSRHDSLAITPTDPRPPSSYAAPAIVQPLS